MASTSTKVTLKLLVDTSGEKVLFAEASKEFIDFLFNLLRMPIGTVTRLLTKNGMVGWLGKLYGSVENLSDTYLLHPNKDKDALLKPNNKDAISGLLHSSSDDGCDEEYSFFEPVKPINKAAFSGLLLPSNDDDNGGNDSEHSKLYMCRKCCNYNVTHVLNTAGPSCRKSMNVAVPYVGEQDAVSSHSGFVKEDMTYMLMDDLVVQPMSTISIITLLNKFNIKEVGALKEKVVELGMEEGIKLIKASLQCKNVLTSVFLKNMGA